jgi:DNA-binding response OmpR family regulator
MSLKRLLLIDDEEPFTRLLKLNLEETGRFTVRVETDGRKALEAAHEFEPDLILLDVIMPGRNGFQICRDLKQNPEHHRIPILVVTSKNSESDRFWAEQQGADGYVTKPFTKESLLLEVSTLLSR